MACLLEANHATIAKLYQILGLSIYVLLVLWLIIQLVEIHVQTIFGLDKLDNVWNSDEKFMILSDFLQIGQLGQA